MFDRRTKNVEIFRDTEKMYHTNETLKEAIEQSIRNQNLILESEKIDYEMTGGREGKVVVSGKRTLEASEQYAKEGKRVCVLNFASATNPGGGVVRGSSAQEEAICRCSTLYPCLNITEMWDNFYQPHRKVENPLYNDDCIFTPEVKVFKSDTSFPEKLPEEAWWSLDVITCAAPNLRRSRNDRDKKKTDISNRELRTLHTRRIQRIFEIAMANKAEVLILGAFGCGAFCNPPQVVAEVFAKFTEKYREYFDVIEYAVYHTDRETTNYTAFKAAMQRFV